MSIITALDEKSVEKDQSIGRLLACLRQEKGYTIDYVANKLNLRACIIELIEKNEFHELPEPVFIKGYLRAYAKLLGASPETYLTIFNDRYLVEKKNDYARLWQQSKREPHKAEYVVRWVTVLFALGVIVAVSVWWQKNRDSQQVFSSKSTPVELSHNQVPATETTDVRLTDISKMQSLLNSRNESSNSEKIGD